MKQIIFTLQCLYTIWLNIVIIIQIHQEVYGDLKEMKFHLIMLNWLDNSQSFKCKAAFIGKTVDAVNNTNNSVKDTKVVVPLKYLSDFWRSLEMPIITYWILSSAGNCAKFEITDAKLQVLIVTLSTKDNLNLLKIVLIMTKQLSDGFKRSVYWNSYQVIPAKVIEK